MMRRAHWIVLAAALALAACGQQQQPDAEAPAPADDVEAAAPAAPQLPPVEQALLDTPNSAFVAFEPTEAGIVGAANVHEALGPLVSAESESEGETVYFTVRETGETAVADIVRANMPDDSIRSSHLRVEFRREPEGWFPTNAYRRTMCQRGPNTGQWTTEVCP